jgi:aldose 1-epimerase
MNNLLEHKLANRHGCSMTVTNFGGKVMSLFVPDRNGTIADIVLGYDTPAEYVNGSPYFGAIIGRFGNRIAEGRFSLEGKTYQLPVNNRSNCLHGGNNGFHNVIWDVVSQSVNGLELQYLSRDGEEGFPGNLSCKVSYELTDDNELVIDYSATTDSPTVVNLTHHSFFNLNGGGNGDVLEHQLLINADRYCPVNENLIPTGRLDSVSDSPFDFLQFHAIGSRINLNHEQLKMGSGYDHSWALNKKEEFSLAAKVYEPQSGRAMEVWTTEPGLQFYSGNFLNGSDGGKGGKKYGYRSGFCLEAQHFPDSPNQPNFPTTVLLPGQEYKQRTVYKFGVRG